MDLAVTLAASRALPSGRRTPSQWISPAGPATARPGH